MSKTKTTDGCQAKVDGVPCGRPVHLGIACKEHRLTAIPLGGGVYQRGGSFLAVSTYNNKQVRTSHATKREAVRARADRTHSKATHKVESKVPVDKYATEWLDSAQGRTSRGLDDGTRASYRRAFELYLLPALGRMPIRDVTRRDVERLIGKLQRDGKSAATIARYLAGARAMFADAVERGDVNSNPFVRLRINAKVGGSDAVADDEQRALTRSELAAILAAVPERWRLLFELLAGSGVRISELIGLDWSDLEQDGDVTSIKVSKQHYRGVPKTTKSKAGKRVVDLDPDLARKLWAAGGDKVGPMFCTRSGERLSDRNVTRTLHSATRPRTMADGTVREAAAGPDLEWVTLHSFRHSHGSWLLDQGWTHVEVSERLGHSSPAVTMAVYAHKMRDRRREVPSFTAAPVEQLAV